MCGGVWKECNCVGNAHLIIIYKKMFRQNITVVVTLWVLMWSLNSDSRLTGGQLACLLCPLGFMWGWIRTGWVQKGWMQVSSSSILITSGTLRCWNSHISPQTIWCDWRQRVQVILQEYETCFSHFNYNFISLTVIFKYFCQRKNRNHVKNWLSQTLCCFSLL